MKITEYLSADSVIADVGAGSPADILARLVEPLGAKGDIGPAGEVMEALLARERLGSTGIGEGVALPHAKVRGIEGLSIAFGRSVNGVEFGAIDGRPVTILFLLLAPEHSSGLHLKALAKISRIVRDSEFRGRLLAAPGAEEIHALLREADEAF